MNIVLNTLSRPICSSDSWACSSMLWRIATALRFASSFSAWRSRSRSAWRCFKSASAPESFSEMVAIVRRKLLGSSMKLAFSFVTQARLSYNSVIYTKGSPMYNQFNTIAFMAFVLPMHLAWSAGVMKHSLDSDSTPTSLLLASRQKRPPSAVFGAGLSQRRRRHWRPLGVFQGIVERKSAWLASTPCSTSGHVALHVVHCVHWLHFPWTVVERKKKWRLKSKRQVTSPLVEMAWA